MLIFFFRYSASCLVPRSNKCSKQNGPPYCVILAFQTVPASPVLTCFIDLFSTRPHYLFLGVKALINPAATCAQMHTTLGDLKDCSPPGSFVDGIFQARILDQVAISSSRGSSQPRDQTFVSCTSCIGRLTLYH